MSAAQAPRWKLIQELRMNVYTNLPQVIDRLMAQDETEAVSLMLTLRVDYEMATTRLAQVEALLPAFENVNPHTVAELRAALGLQREAD